MVRNTITCEFPGGTTRLLKLDELAFIQSSLDQCANRLSSSTPFRRFRFLARVHRYHHGKVGGSDLIGAHAYCELPPRASGYRRATDSANKAKSTATAPWATAVEEDRTGPTRAERQHASPSRFRSTSLRASNCSDSETNVRPQRSENDQVDNLDWVCTQGSSVR